MDYFRIFILLIILLICLAFSSFFSCADMVYSVVDKLRLQKDVEKGSKRAKLALKFATEYDKTISSIIFSNNLVNIGASSITAILGYQIFLSYNEDFASQWGPFIAASIFVLILIAFGEVIPKVIGRSYSYKFSKMLAYPVKFFMILFFPFVFVTTWLGKIITKPFFDHHEKQNDRQVSDEELQEMVSTIEEEGVIDENQSELLRSAIEFKETEAYEIMTPRVDVFAFDIDDDIEKLINNDEIFEYSRVPVFEGSLDNIIGVLSTKVLLKTMLKKEKIDVRRILVPEINVPRGMTISQILSILKKSRSHIAIVKDEFGGTEGILTMEDILEELVGEIWDETDEITEMVIEKSDNEYIIDGMMNIEDFFELVGIDNEEVDTDYSTVGGWVIDYLDRFANEGDHFVYKRISVFVLKTDEFTVKQIKVIVHPKKSRAKKNDLV